MISPQVLKHAVWFHGVAHYPVNICLTCGAEDDPETTKFWPADKDNDRICPNCFESESNATMTLDRVEAAIAFAFKAETTTAGQRHYFDALTVVIHLSVSQETKEAISELDDLTDPYKRALDEVADKYFPERAA